MATKMFGVQRGHARNFREPKVRLETRKVKGIARIIELAGTPCISGAVGLNCLSPATNLIVSSRRDCYESTRRRLHGVPLIRRAAPRCWLSLAFSVYTYIR